MQIIEPVTFARCAFIIALRSIALVYRIFRYMQKHLEHLRHVVRPDYNCERSELSGLFNGTDLYYIYIIYIIIIMYISGRTSCRKCSKCFYVYLNIR